MNVKRRDHESFWWILRVSIRSLLVRAVSMPESSETQGSPRETENVMSHQVLCQGNLYGGSPLKGGSKELERGKHVPQVSVGASQRVGVGVCTWVGWGWLWWSSPTVPRLVGMSSFQPLPFTSSCAAQMYFFKRNNQLNLLCLQKCPKNPFLGPLTLYINKLAPDLGRGPGRKVEHALVSLLTEIAQSLLRVTDVKEPPSNCDPIRRIIVLHAFFFPPNTD